MAEGSDHLQIAVEPTGDTARVKLDGELDIHTAPGVAEAITGALDGGATTVVVDAAALRFCDSSGIQVLVQARERLVAVRRHPPDRGRPRLRGEGPRRHRPARPLQRGRSDAKRRRRRRRRSVTVVAQTIRVARLARPR